MEEAIQAARKQNAEDPKVKQLSANLLSTDKKLKEEVDKYASSISSLESILTCN